MDLKENKGKLKAIEFEITAVSRRTTPEIEQIAQHLRELREDFSRNHICPLVNRLLEEKRHLLNFNKLERMRLDAKKPVYPEPIRNWLQGYRKSHKGTYRIRAFDIKREWVIFTKLPSHGRQTEHLAYRLSDSKMPLFSQHGKLTKAALAQMIEDIESRFAPLNPTESPNTEPNNLVNQS